MSYYKFLHLCSHGDKTVSMTSSNVYTPTSSDFLMLHNRDKVRIVITTNYSSYMLLTVPIFMIIISEKYYIKSIIKILKTEKLS